MLKDSEKARYSRQIRLFGEEGQEKLKETAVFIAGAAAWARSYPSTWQQQVLANCASWTATESG